MYHENLEMTGLIVRIVYHKLVFHGQQFKRIILLEYNKTNQHEILPSKGWDNVNTN